jgi:hypothetical protein
MTTAAGRHTAAELTGFRRWRRPAPRCAEAVAARLARGGTERDAAWTQRAWLCEQGVRDRGVRRPEPGMPFVWDLAPVTQHCVATVGHSDSRRWAPRLFRFGTGSRGPGVKSEEILVVTDSTDPTERAYWPDDDLPHARRWTEEQ